jgi:hypothetical protein
MESLDLDPVGQKLPTKIENVNKFDFLKRWTFYFEGFKGQLREMVFWLNLSHIV